MNEIQKTNESDVALVASDQLYEFSRDLIINSRMIVHQAANHSMVKAYWRIGEKIVEEQGGSERSKYGNKLIESLSKRLTAEFGNGFTVRNLHAMRQFYLRFPIVHALRAQLSSEGT